MTAQACVGCMDAISPPFLPMEERGIFMTEKQMQCLLCYLGYYDGAIDGIWGEKSIGAAMAFQRDQELAADGVFGEASQARALALITGGDGEWWAEIAYFTPREFACKCGHCGGYPAQMSRTVVQTADRVRRHFDAPAIVSSGLRCKAHNANVGGVANSRHLCGKAMDFCIAGKSAGEVLAYVKEQPQIRYAYAIDGQFVHMDVV